MSIITMCIVITIVPLRWLLFIALRWLLLKLTFCFHSCWISLVVLRFRSIWIDTALTQLVLVSDGILDSTEGSMVSDDALAGLGASALFIYMRSSCKNLFLGLAIALSH